jgi:polyisoprenoid-binding protein YceI
LPGDLSIREVTQPVTIEVSMQGSEEASTGEANATILMGDFGIGPVRIDNILTQRIMSRSH